MSTDVTEQLLALVQAEAKSSESRTRLLHDLSDTVRVLRDRRSCRDPLLINAVQALAAALITAGDHAEFIAERIMSTLPQ